jgi:hypothetical protein
VPADLQTRSKSFFPDERSNNRNDNTTNMSRSKAQGSPVVLASNRHIAGVNIEIRANPSNQRHPRSMQHYEAGFSLTDGPLMTLI